MLKASKQVKAGIKSARGPKSYNVFGMKELTAFLNVQKVVMFDLTELKPLSVALNSAALHIHQEGYHLQKRDTSLMVENVKKVLEEHVNPVDEEHEQEE
jgi:hypothetical protein